ncbi:NAK protein kinase, partial [Sphaeroforma arctica JP610]
QKLGSQHEGFVKLIGSEVLNNRESGHSNAEVLIIMELCPGSLIHIMNDRREGFEPHDVVRIFHALTASVRFLHEQNPPIIHRDLKVENILVDKNGNVKLCDFGSATTKILSPKSAAEIAMAEEEIQLNTTPQYRAPEMWDFYEYGSVDYKSDIWSLGCALYKICYYRTPFDDGSKMVICNAELKLPPAVGSNVVFHDMMRAILKKDPKQRPNAGQILEMLTQISNKLGPKPRGPDALALPQEEMPISGSIGTDEVKDRVMGAFRSVKNKVEDAVAGSGLTNPASNKGVEIEGDFNYTYITPRIMGMRVPNFKAVKSFEAVQLWRVALSRGVYQYMYNDLSTVFLQQLTPLLAVLQSG